MYTTLHAFDVVLRARFIYPSNRGVIQKAIHGQGCIHILYIIHTTETLNKI